MSLLSHGNGIEVRLISPGGGPIRLIISTAESIVTVGLKADSGVSVIIKVDLAEVDVRGARWNSRSNEEARTGLGRNVREDRE